MGSWNYNMDDAPIDRPILAICSFNCTDPDCSENPENKDKKSPFKVMCLYHAHGDLGYSLASDGPHVIEWGGGWREDMSYMPDWWFVYGTDFEVVANPIAWREIEPLDN